MNSTEISHQPSKRPRFDDASGAPRMAHGGAAVQNDCYNDVMKSNEPLPIIMSWMTDSRWFHALDPLPDDHENDMLRHEIHSLQLQLAQVKDRLMPTAERCSTSVGKEFRSSPSLEFMEARKACNPMEILGMAVHHSFLNRAAIKLANIDAIAKFSLISATGVFRFVDLCGAPGGFSEYILDRGRRLGLSDCRGYGMSLEGRNEQGEGLKWKLKEYAGSEWGTGITSKFLICRGSDGTGDVFCWNNVEALHRLIREDSGSSKVQLVLADGGFDAQRGSNHQEQLATRIVVCQVVAALSLLAQGGTIVVKMFGFQTDVIRTMLVDLSWLFDHLAATKPISSRPASAERYLVCTGFRGVPSDWNPRRWRDTILLGSSYRFRRGLTPEQQDHVRRLHFYTDSFDRDMLRLNSKTCFAILSYLENKARAVESGNVVEDSPSTWVEPRKYRLAWCLE